MTGRKGRAGIDERFVFVVFVRGFPLSFVPPLLYICICLRLHLRPAVDRRGARKTGSRLFPFGFCANATPLFTMCEMLPFCVQLSPYTTRLPPLQHNRQGSKKARKNKEKNPMVSRQKNECVCIKKDEGRHKRRKIKKKCSRFGFAVLCLALKSKGNVENKADVLHGRASQVFENRDQIEELVIMGIREPATDRHGVLRVEDV